jgi:RNA polymerase sigma factor (sigma-70 family)
MAVPRPGFAQREISTLFRDGLTTALTDQELLARFLDYRGEGGEAAFATLVMRHGPMVLGTCRQILRDSADADDAFQATFLVLVRRAGSIRFGTSLGPWLHGVSVKVARRVGNVRSRRKYLPLDDAVEEVLAARRGTGITPDVRLTINEALSRLPVRYRDAIEVCYLEGMTHEEAATRLRCPVGTVRSRLARGRAMLRNGLASSGMIAKGMGRSWDDLLDAVSTKCVVESRLMEMTTRAAAGVVAGQSITEVVPGGIAVIVTGVLRMMLITRYVVVASVLACTGLTGWGALSLAETARKPVELPTQRGSKELQRAPDVALAQAKQAEPVAVEQPEAAVVDPLADSSILADLPAVVIKVEPALGAEEVDPNLKELRVTFSKEMTDGSWAWTSGNVYATPKSAGKVHYEKGLRTCVMPVKLEPGKTYVMGINSEKFRGFRDAKGQPALPYLVAFKTRKAR